MIFTPEHCAMNVAGTKTNTRRLQEEGDFCVYDEATGKTILAVFTANMRTKYEVGHTYANQPGRGKPANGRIRLLAIREEALWAITDEDIRAEGCKDLVEFGRVWNSIYKNPKERWMGMPTVWVLLYGFVKASEVA